MPAQVNRDIEHTAEHVQIGHLLGILRRISGLEVRCRAVVSVNQGRSNAQGCEEASEMHVIPAEALRKPIVQVCTIYEYQ